MVPAIVDKPMTLSLGEAIVGIFKHRPCLIKG